MGRMCAATGSIRSYGELRALGLSRGQIRGAVRTGRAWVIRRGVYAVGSACAAARDAAAHGGALACVTAARHLGLWILDEDDARTHVWLRRGGHAYPHVDGPCSCVEHWDEGVPSSVFGLPPARHVLWQIRQCFDIEHFFVALESALSLDLLSAADLAWLRARRGGDVREALALARSDADSGLESLLRWRLRAHGLHIRTQRTIHDAGRVDVLIGERLIVEADGKGNHDGTSHRHKDLVRDTKAAVWGYVTLRFDYALIVHDWPLVEAAILGHVAAGRHL